MPEPKAHSDADRPTRRVLVVDAGTAAVTMYRRAVEPLGLEVEVCASADSALDRLRAHPVAVMFLDLRLPDRDGHALLKDMRQIPHHSDTPAVVVTSKDYQQDRAEARAQGVVDYLLKPLTSEEIRDVVRRIGVVEG